MNWYKIATEGREVPITSEGFGAMTREEKVALARKTSLALATQRLFFTEEYGNKSQVLENLAWNRSVHPEVQPLFFTEEYGKKGAVLWDLAGNSSITPETQRLLITEKYEEKDNALWILAKNENFLRDFTREELLLIKGVARGNLKLHVLSKRLKQIVGVP